MPGPLTHSPANVVRWLLIDLGHGTDPLDEEDWPIFCPAEPAVPDRCITVGNTPGSSAGDTMQGERIERNGVQVKVRSGTEVGGWQKVREITDELNSIKDRSITVAEDSDRSIPEATYVVTSLLQTGDVTSLGKETPISKRQLFTANFSVSLRQT